MYYSAINNCFYPEELRKEYGDSWPSDAIKATDEEWQEYGLNRPPFDKIRGSLEGRPVWIEKPAISPFILAEEERYWRNNELKRADIELNKVQDSDSKATGVVGDWRNYRKFLRAWPENIDFPNKNFRPVAPDA